MVHLACSALLASALSSCAPSDGEPTPGIGGATGQGQTGGTAVPGTGGAPPASGGSSVATGGSGTGGASGTGGSSSGTGGSAGGGAAATGGGGIGEARSGGRGGATGVGSGGTAAGGRGTAGTSGSAGGVGSTETCPASALVCEDFEDSLAQGWSAFTGGMTIDSTHVVSGTKSVLLNIPAGQRGGLISRKGAPLFPLVNKVMWGRVMLWFDAVADGHTDIVRAQSAAGGNPAYNLAEQHGDYMLNYYNGSQATDCWARPKAPTPTKLPIGKWSCWEWKFDSGTNNVQFFVDGALYRAVNMTGDGCLTGNGVWAAPPEFGTVSVGAYIAEVGGAMKLWFDDIAVGTQERIGCPAH